MLRAAASLALAVALGGGVVIADASPGVAVCDEIIVVGETAGGFFGEAGSVQCGPGSSSGEGRTGSATSRCTYTYTEVAPWAILWWTAEGLKDLPEGEPLPGAGETLNWYAQECPDDSRALIAVPITAAIVDGVVVDPWTAAMWARDDVTLPEPVVAFNPDLTTEGGSGTVVTVPTWWWIENWLSHTARADAGPVWAEVTATPVSSRWDPGDGQDPVDCAGPGIPWARGLDEDDPRACSYTYARSSAGQPGEVYTVTVTVTWEITWSGSGGTGGTLPELITQTVLPVGVLEIQALVTG